MSCASKRNVFIHLLNNFHHAFLAVRFSNTEETFTSHPSHWGCHEQGGNVRGNLFPCSSIAPPKLVGGSPGENVRILLITSPMYTSTVGRYYRYASK